MKLFNGKDDELYLSRKQWIKVLFAVIVISLSLYIFALALSLSGNGKFLCDYHNATLSNIEKVLKEHHIYALITSLFISIETYIVLCFVLKKVANALYLVIIYLTIIGVAFLGLGLPQIFYTGIGLLYVLIFPLIDMAITEKKIVGKKYLSALIRFLIAIGITIIYQLIIYGIKAGNMKFTNGSYNLETYFIYNIEYYIALIISLLFVDLCIKEKGDNKLWMTSQEVGGFSQTSKKKSQILNSMSKKKKTTNLTKTQKRKLRFLYIRTFIIQCGGFLLLMVLPFLIGKVFEFLVMYFSFVIVRAILGFKYSLHYNKETTCIFVGVIVFSILALVIPFFSILIITAVAIGSGLAFLLHLSYKYKGMWLFMHVANTDRYAELFVIFNANTERKYVIKMASHYGVTDKDELLILADYMEHSKLSYLAKKYHYSQREINYKLDNILKVIKQNI